MAVGRVLVRQICAVAVIRRFRGVSVPHHNKIATGQRVRRRRATPPRAPPLHHSTTTATSAVKWRCRPCLTKVEGPLSPTVRHSFPHAALAETKTRSSPLSFFFFFLLLLLLPLLNV